MLAGSHRSFILVIGGSLISMESRGVLIARSESSMLAWKRWLYEAVSLASLRANLFSSSFDFSLFSDSRWFRDPGATSLDAIFQKRWEGSGHL